MRSVDEAEALGSLDGSAHSVPRWSVAIDTAQLAADLDAGQWGGHDRYLRQKALETHSAAEAAEDPELHYFGLAEIPHVLAFGAALGSERALVVHEYDRDRNGWTWPDDAPAKPITIVGAPEGPVVTSRGIAVLRVAISSEIQDADIRAAVGEETLADVTVRFGEEPPGLAKVRSADQLLAIRDSFRQALAALKNYRPGVERIHLFAAVPNSVALVIGQELVPRNSPPVQTYRYRPQQNAEAFQPAILITAAESGEQVATLSDEELDVANRVRTVFWPKALHQVRNYAGQKATERGGRAFWYERLEPAAELFRAAPFPSLPRIENIVPQNDTVDYSPYAGDYGHDHTKQKWRLGDQLLLGMHRAASGSDDALLLLLRLFLFHEYVHDYHSLTKYTAQNVGKFANALERLDYTADTYAMIHELDFSRYDMAGPKLGDLERLQILRSLVDQVLRSIWAFDGSGPHDSLQVRRIRRYMNWYWRHAQLERAPDLEAAVRLFSKPPVVELAGLRLTTDGARRVFAQFRQAPAQRLELAIVLEDERLVRINDSDSVEMQQLLDAFRNAHHDTIKQWFRPVFELAKAHGAVFPEAHPLASAQGAQFKL